jgi:hypothetical protein
MKNFKLSVWSRSPNQRSKPLGKSYGLKNGKLVKKDLGMNATRFRVETIESLDDLEFLIDFDLHQGDGFITSGLPKNPDVTEAKVTVKDFPKKDHISRTRDDIEWRSGTGTYCVIDYDPEWSND